MVLGQGRHSKEEKSSRDVRVGRGEVKEGHIKLHCHKSRVLGAAVGVSAGGCCCRWVLQKVGVAEGGCFGRWVFWQVGVAAGGCCSRWCCSRWEQVSFCHSDTSYSPWRKGTSVEELPPSDRTVKNFLDCWLMCEGPAHPGQCHLGCIRKEAEQATGSKSVSYVPPWRLPAPAFLGDALYTVS